MTAFAMTAFTMPATAKASAQGRQFKAFLSALSLEVLLIGAGLLWLTMHPSQPIDVIVPLTIEVTPTAEPEKLAEPEMAKLPPPQQLPTPTAPALKPPPVLQTKPMPVAAVTPASTPATPVAMAKPLPAPSPAPAPALNSVPEPSVNLPTAAATPTVATASVSTPTPASPPSIDPSPAYNAKLASAVQAVFEVPAAAAELNFKGRARVEFNLRDGVVSKVRIVQTSGLGVADRAAVKAVQAAVYPAPPPPLQGKEATYQIWVACL
jgi:periplasmic protein TonB